MRRIRLGTLSHYMVAALCVIIVAAAGFLTGFSSVYVKSWSLVIIEQEVDSAEAVHVPGVRYKVTYQVGTREGLSKPREDVRTRPLGCGRILIQTPLLMGARQVVFTVRDEQLPQQARRCRDNGRVALRVDAPKTTVLVALRPSIELPLKRWYGLDENPQERGDAMIQQ